MIFSTRTKGLIFLGLTTYTILVITGHGIINSWIAGTSAVLIYTGIEGLYKGYHKKEEYKNIIDVEIIPKKEEEKND